VGAALIAAFELLVGNIQPSDLLAEAFGVNGFPVGHWQKTTGFFSFANTQEDGKFILAKIPAPSVFPVPPPAGVRCSRFSVSLPLHNFLTDHRIHRQRGTKAVEQKDSGATGSVARMRLVKDLG
jgi:hypothetical protein